MVVRKQDGWKEVLTRKFGHIMSEWTQEGVLFTRAELTILYRSFFHHSAQILYNLIRRLRPKHTSPATRALLEEISRQCTTCTTIGARPLRFRVAMLDEDLVFNEELSIDLM